MKTIVEGLAVEYRDQGAGPVWLYVHGWKDDLRTFDPLVAALHKHRTVRLDLPGFGASDTPREPWGVGDYARFVRSFLDKLDMAPDIIIGHSLGGRIAIRGIADGQLTPRKLVLIASAGVAERDAVRTYAFAAVVKVGKFITSLPLLSRLREPLRRILYGPTPSDYETAGALKDTFLKVIAENLSDAAKSITTPTLLIWGAHDTQTPLEEGERLHSYIQGSRLEVIEDADHFVHREAPEKLATMIKVFSAL